jgi:hypothetical protein
MKNEKIEFENIKSISGSAQQHGSGLEKFYFLKF